MKTKILFASLFASAVMVGCSNEELPVAQNAATDNLALIFDGIEGLEGVDSRMAYENGKFKWAVKDEIGVSRTSGKSVTTNYLFEARKVTDDNTKPLDQWESSGEDLYAYFETDFGSIFKGDYVVYYPYDKNFCEDGKITAKLKVGQVEDATDATAHVAADGFMMSAPVAFEGGQSAEKFVLYPVFGRLAIKVKNKLGYDCKIETIVLRSVNGGKTMPTAMEIDADVNVVNGTLNPAAMHVIEGSKVEEIVLAVNNSSNVTSEGYTAYLTVVPGNYSNLAIDIVTSEGTYTETYSNAPVKAGTKTDLTIEMTQSGMSVKRAYYAADETSWNTAVNKIASSMTNNETGDAAIKVLSDIVVTADKFRPNNNMNVKVPVTVKGEGSITVVGSTIAGMGAFTNMNFDVPVEFVKTDNGDKEGMYRATSNENIVFNKGLTADRVLMGTGIANSNYVINGGEIGVVDLWAENGTNSLTAKDVVFTGLVTTKQTAALDANKVAKVNFNNCTFEVGLTNIQGEIRLDEASIVRPNSWSAMSVLNVAGGGVYLDGDVTINNYESGGGKTIAEAGAEVEIDNYLAAIEGTIDVKKGAVLTLGAKVEYLLNGKIAVDGKLVNNGTLSATAEEVIGDVDDNNANVGKLINKNIVRVTADAYTNNAWYTNQNITFENNAHYNFVLTDAAAWATYANKTDITGIEVKNVSDISPKGKGTNGNVIDFSSLNLILNACNEDLTVNITDGLKFKNIEIKKEGENNKVVTLKAVTKDAVVTTGNLNVYNILNVLSENNDYRTKVNAENVTVAEKAALYGSKQVSCTGTLTNKGTVSNDQKSE